MKLCGVWYGLGAPDRLLNTVQCAGMTEFLRQGYRVLAFVRTEHPLTGQTPPSAEQLGWVLLNNPVRPQAAATFAYFADNDVAIKVLSGDHPEAAAHAAMLAGIPDADRWVDASVLTTDEQLAQAAVRYTVFGRVTPVQKQVLIRLLRQNGHTVGMVGDGVNDVLALREADCSAAMASGSEAAAQITQMVLLESDFSRMPAIVAEGRRVVNNIQRSAGLFLIKNIYSLLLTLFSLLFGFAYPLQPAQLSLVSLFTIGIPSFLLTMEPDTGAIRGPFLPQVFRSAAPAAVTAFLCTVFVVVYGQAVSIPAEAVSTQCALLLAFVGFTALIRICAPMNLRRLSMIMLLLAGLTGCALGLHRVFALSPMDNGQRLLMVPVCTAALTVFRCTERIVGRLWHPQQETSA
jgi:cation-transporting ATPase E